MFIVTSNEPRCCCPCSMDLQLIGTLVNNTAATLSKPLRSKQSDIKRTNTGVMIAFKQNNKYTTIQHNIRILLYNIMNVQKVTELCLYELPFTLFHLKSKSMVYNGPKCILKKLLQDSGIEPPPLTAQRVQMWCSIAVVQGLVLYSVFWQLSETFLI